VESKSNSGKGSVCLQSFVNGSRAWIPLSIYIEPKYWDEKSGSIKAQHPDNAHLNKIISDARTRVAEIHLLANNKKLLLTAKSFRAMFEERSSNGDFLKFMECEIVERFAKLDIKRNTYKCQLSTIHIFKEFKRGLEFSEISIQLIESFRLWLKARKLHINTIAGHLKNFRTYMNRAIDAGYQFEYPFEKVKIKRVKSNRVFLVESEVQRLLDSYYNNELPEHLHSTLMFFLVACFTSLRVSDVRKIKRRMVKGNALYLEPTKTNQMNKWIEIPLSQIAQKIVSDVLSFSGKVKSEQRMNDDLKVIAAMCGIKKSLTFHVGRHTFATIFLRLGGKVEVLKEILGHEKIETTMEYVHIVQEDKRTQILNFDKVFA
jgi:site-specific recombinase XerD